MVCKPLDEFFIRLSSTIEFVRSFNDCCDNEDDDDSSSEDCSDLAQVIGDEMERRHILILPASQSTLPQDIARTQLGPCITLLLDLRTSPLCTPEDIGSSPNLLQDHLLACGTSSSTSAYIYYLGFLEQVFHTIARILGRLKEESGSADGALELWSVEMADPRAHWNLQQTIVPDHANAVRVCTHSVTWYSQAGLTASKGGSSEVPRARFDGCRCRRCGELGLPSV